MSLGSESGKDFVGDCDRLDDEEDKVGVSLVGGLPLPLTRSVVNVELPAC
jgi:hypothetical protein